MSQKKQITTAILKELDQWDQTAMQINSGQCPEFGHNVRENLLPEIEVIITGCEFGGYEPFGDGPDGEPHDYGGHVWIHDPETGLHFDAECPYGTAHWKNLPFFDHVQE